MGAYINIGNAGFKSSRKREYIDKSGLIAIVNDTLFSKWRFSCVTRCPRNNKAGLIIMALRSLSIQTGFFMESEKGRQMYLLCKDLNSNILNYGYCVYPRTFKYDGHMEAGLVWEWVEKNMDDVFDRLGANLDKDGPGAMRRIPQKDLDELKRIYDVTGATEMLENVKRAGLEKARELGLTEEEYCQKLYSECSPQHFNH